MGRFEGGNGRGEMIYDIISKNETSKDKVKQNSNGGHQTS